MSARHVGRAEPRREDPRLLTGRGRYVADVTRPRMLDAVFVRSTEPHAQIRSVDTADAAAMDGVEAVLTAAELPAVTLHNQRHPRLQVTEQPVLAVDRVRFVGEAVAIVVAGDRYLAEDAADGVGVEYDPVEPGTDLFAHIPGNVVFRDAQRYGDVDAAFDGAATVVASTLAYPRQVACPLEARGCVADYDPSAGELTVWASTQAPHRLRRDLAEALEMQENRVRVVMNDIGGGFGQKIPTHLEEVGVALASVALGRPVRWVEDRQENLVSAPHSRDQTITVWLALDEHLRITGMRTRIEGDAGAYSFNSATCLTEAYRAARAMTGVYRVPAYGYDVSIELSTKSPIGPYRGVGFVAAQCARELAVDKAARRLGVDRSELRRINMIEPSDLPYTTCTGWRLDDVSCRRTFELAHEHVRDALDELGDARPGEIRGVGISPFVEPSGTGGEGARQVHGFASPSHDLARVALDTSGTVTVVVGTPSMGQGLETTLAQVAADAVGADLDSVRVVWSDTSQAPMSLTGSRASRAAVVGGGAVGRAGTAVRDQILEVAAELLEANAADLRVADGQVGIVGEAEPRLSVRDVVRAGYFREELRGETDRAFEATRFFDPPASYSNACVAAIVAVDRATGAVRVERVIGVEDCGTMINPQIVDGQFVGGVAQGIGMALLERFHYGPDGQPQTATLMDYLQPTATDVPPVDVIHVNTPSAVTWEGIKGMGESGVIGAASAVAAAAADALATAGADVAELPLLPCTVWTLLDGAAAPR